MSTKVYWGSGSPFCWQILLAAHHKGLAFESHRLDLGKKEHRTPDLMALNPRGQVPFLVDEDGTVAGSVPILAYLERRYPKQPLFGETAAETGRVWNELEQQRTHVHDAATAIIRPIFRSTLDSQRDAVIEAIPNLHRELERLESVLSQTPWLCGDALSAADVVLLPTLERLLRAAKKQEASDLPLGLLPMTERYTHLARWHQGYSALPYFDACYPPHWRSE